MVSNRYESRSSRSIRLCPTVAFQTIDYKLSSLFYLSVGGETTEAEADGGVGLGGVRPRERRTCEGPGMPEVQAESVEAANLYEWNVESPFT